MKFITACPTYGPVDPGCTSALRRSAYTAAAHGFMPVGDISPDKVAFGGARNMIVRTFLESLDVHEADGIVWVDSDIVPEPQSIWKLLATAEREGHDFVTGIYHNRKGDHRPCIYRYVQERDTFSQVQYYEPDMLVKMDGCGFGFVYTSTKLLKAIQALPAFSEDNGEWFPDRRQGFGKFGEDLGFCRQVLDTGIQLWADSGVQVGHMGDVQIIGRDQFLKKLVGKGNVKRIIGA